MGIWEFAGSFRRRIRYSGATTEDIAPVADELARFCNKVRTFTWVGPHGGDGPVGVPEYFMTWGASLVIVFSIVTKGFFEEMGKDAYKSLREKISYASHKAKNKDIHSPHKYALAFELKENDLQVTFAFREVPNEEDLARAIRAIPSLLEIVPKNERIYAEFLNDIETWRWEILRPPER